jgi:hypothetical protein
MNALKRDYLLFLHSFPDFQQLFPDGARSSAYIEKARWGDTKTSPRAFFKNSQKTILRLVNVGFPGSYTSLFISGSRPEVCPILIQPSSVP